MDEREVGLAPGLPFFLVLEKTQRYAGAWHAKLGCSHSVGLKDHTPYQRLIHERANCHKEFTMSIRTPLCAAMTALVLLAAPGCAVTRGQETMGAYVDDTTITTQIKARFIDNTSISAAAISVETLNGTVMLSGFAKNALEKSTAESIARSVNGVKAVRNEIAIHP
jgi:hyperosmotically inducible protein